MSPPDPTDGTVPPELPGDPSTEESWATHASVNPADLEEDLITRVGAAGLGSDSGTDPVPEYELLTLLGEGGMGRVWKARQTRLNRLVALKMVLGDKPAGSKDLIRFLAEAESVAAVRHPNVVQVYEYGEFSGRPFLAMEYLPGGSLADRLKAEGRLDPKSAAKLVGTLASAVHAAHDLGIVHRDLKPANVLFDEHGEPRVADFGIAKRATTTDLTATQAVMGTPAYMAPEQARGETKFVGPQADVYSLGVILYECLTGTRPFVAADPLALLRKVEDEEPERPSRRVPGFTPRRRADLPEMPGQGPGRTLPDGRGPCVGPSAFRGGRDGERAVGRDGRAGGEMGPSEADAGRAARWVCSCRCWAVWEAWLPGSGGRLHSQENG
ncbi:MAG: serine/threonine-protein kinase [Isosphaeraceae bacterium]